jgi:hypothetical protein
VSAEEYDPVHFIPSDEDRERFLRIEQGSSCEINDLLYVQDTMTSNNQVRNSAILNHLLDFQSSTFFTRIRFIN